MRILATIILVMGLPTSAMARDVCLYIAKHGTAKIPGQEEAGDVVGITPVKNGVCVATRAEKARYYIVKANLTKAQEAALLEPEGNQNPYLGKVELLKARKRKIDLLKVSFYYNKRVFASEVVNALVDKTRVINVVPNTIP